MFVIRKIAPTDAPTPPATHQTFFIDDNGNPSLKDSMGVVTPATNAGNPLTLNEQVTAPATQASKVQLYSKAVGASTELFTLDPFSNEVRVTDGGSIAAQVPGRPGQTTLTFTTTGSQTL